ncbi:hypothetical protein H8F21_13380 [Pseudomonas sp. P66]|uniref:DUF2939 domain-containing protein n=1 Tax=Pseudomonas arcuscaelestis TaxID=2710591 RepID=A0ABS2BYN6_9PSED|nr:hypothetical protein [Pseudomonas arcuscaelestis]MBM5458555.1 hypothetical protein [Pseudomonas arcuscaelestis]
MSTPEKDAPRRGKPSARTIAALCILAVTVLGSIHAGVKIREYNDFTGQALQLMDSFTADQVAGRPLAEYQSAFAGLEMSDRALGKMLAIAYRERTGSLQERDTSIIAAVNSLRGKDLYKLLSAAEPMFDPSARKAYIEGTAGAVGFPGVDMRFNTFRADQKAAMQRCLILLQQSYGDDSIESRLKFAITLYTGTHWETCTVPIQSRYKPSAVPLNQTI